MRRHITALRIAVVLAALGAIAILTFKLLTVGDRIFVRSQEFDLGTGRTLVETWDDPFDNMKSQRLYWLPSEGSRRELMGEFWGPLYRGWEPTLLEDVPRTVALGRRFFRRYGEESWEECTPDYGALRDFLDDHDARTGAGLSRDDYTSAHWDAARCRLRLEAPEPDAPVLIFRIELEACRLVLDEAASLAASPDGLGGEVAAARPAEANQAPP